MFLAMRIGAVIANHAAQTDHQADFAIDHDGCRGLPHERTLVTVGQQEITPRNPERVVNDAVQVAKCSFTLVRITEGQRGQGRQHHDRDGDDPWGGFLFATKALYAKYFSIARIIG